MESSTQHEEHSGRAVTDCGPSFSNTNVSGAKHTCQSCGITASGSKPNPSSSANTASGQSPTFSSGSETANPSVRGPELAFSGHEDAPRGVNTTSSIPSGVNAASPIHSGVNAASLIAALGNLRWGVNVARRAWLEAADVINTQPVDAFRASLRRNRR